MHVCPCAPQDDALTFNMDGGGTQVGPLLSDVRRVNVAFTRAKSKLIVIGSRSTLENSAAFLSLFGLAGRKGWVREVADVW